MIFGFIGSGNMGGAIIGGIINSDIASSENVIVSDKNEQAIKKRQIKLMYCFCV